MGVTAPKQTPPRDSAPTIPGFRVLKVNGRALTRIDISDDLTAYQFPAAATGQVAVYTDNRRPVAAIRRILRRMKSWITYVIP
jgi:hypothetical protein